MQPVADHCSGLVSQKGTTLPGLGYQQLPVRLLQPFKCQDEQLCVMLVWQRWKRNGREPPTFQPMHGRRVYSHGFLSWDVRTVLCFTHFNVSVQQTIFMSIINVIITNANWGEEAEGI